MAFQDRAPTVGGRLATMATGQEATQAPSDDFLTELGLRALRQAYDTMSERSRTVPGTNPPPTREHTQGLASMRGGGGQPGRNLGAGMGGVNSLIQGAAKNAAQHALNNRNQQFMGARAGQGQQNQRQRPQRPQLPQPMQQQQRQQPQQQAMGFNPMGGMQPFDPYAAYGGLMG
tara:strand:+ start:1444 stop:1965 length:522 start_codon:yes stop_codon:yes gene_type:complete